MHMNKAVLAVVATMLWSAGIDAATTAAVRLCGRNLSEIMSRVCFAYNSPSWNDPTVMEHPATVVRRRRQVGIADECCTFGCTWEQLNEYCAISANSESPFEEHMIAGRSAERNEKPSPVPAKKDSEAPVAPDSPAVASKLGVPSRRREVGRRSHGYGRGRAKTRGRRCRCRRGRQRRPRSGRRRTILMGANEKCRTRCARGGHRIPPTHMG